MLALIYLIDTKNLHALCIVSNNGYICIYCTGSKFWKTQKKVEAVVEDDYYQYHGEDLPGYNSDDDFLPPKKRSLLLSSSDDEAPPPCKYKGKGIKDYRNQWQQ